MTDVYIGNATKQVLQFAYRLPERKNPIVQTIPIYGQQRLSGDFSISDIEYIMHQWGKYGLTHASDIDGEARSFEGYIISTGKPIPSEILVTGANYREDVLKERGKKMRQEAAVAMINTIESETGTIAKTYEISVAEVEPRQGFANPHDHHVAEGFRATSDQRPADAPQNPWGRSGQ